MLQSDLVVTGWRKSSRCESQHCVEVARTADGLAVRDSTDPRHRLAFTESAWRAFTTGLRIGD